MFAPPPKMNRVRIHSINAKELSDFYSDLGMLFFKEVEIINESRIIKYSYQYEDLTLEIRQTNDEKNCSKNLDLLFLIDTIDGYLKDFEKHKIEIIKDSWFTETHQHIIIKDIEGNLTELMTEK